VEVHVLIRGDLSLVRDRFLSSEITGRGNRYPNVPAFPGKGFRLERRYESKESRQGRDLSSAMQGNLCGEEAGVSRGRISPMPGVMPRTW